jgi:23S rRNA pseudouridine1911/1915/1917 synthase
MKITITPEQAGARLDKLVVDAVPGLGRAGAKRLFANDRVRIARAYTPADGETAGARTPPGGEPSGDRQPRFSTASKGDVAGVGDVVDIEVEAEPNGAPFADADAPLAVLYETPEVVVIDKPPGQATAPLVPGEHGTVVNALLARYPEMYGFGFSPRERAVCHRLDTDTSGVLVAARSEQAFADLREGLAQGRFDKRYLLVCAAADLPESGTIEIPLAPHPKDRRRVYPCIHPRDVARYEPRPASTAWTRLAVEGEWALVEARVAKASRHQIRAHFAGIEHPLAGDALYGGPPAPGLSRHALHAHYVGWPGSAVVPAFVVRSGLPAEIAALVPEGAAAL